MTTAYYCIMENKRQYYISLTMLGCLFFIFGLVSWVNSILIPYFKIACELKSGVQTYLVTFAFYIAYLVMTVPASFLLRRTGYKKGTMIGLWTMAIGALLFWPAALTRTLWHVPARLVHHRDGTRHPAVGGESFRDNHRPLRKRGQENQCDGNMQQVRRHHRPSCLRGACDPPAGQGGNGLGRGRIA